MIVRFTTCLLLAGLAGVTSPQVWAGDDVASAATTGAISDVAAPNAPVEGPLTIKQVMRYAMTQHLCKKVIKNQASPAEQQRLVELFEALAKCKPPTGSAASWNEKTAALVTAAKEVAAGKPAQKALMEAANCSACHNEHRPK
jgi:hypothetical protein